MLELILKTGNCFIEKAESKYNYNLAIKKEDS